MLLLADVFENIRHICLEIYALDTARFLTAPGLTLQGSLKKTEIKLDLLTDVAMLLMVEYVIRDGIYNAVHWYAKTNKKYMEDFDRNLNFNQ